MLRHALLLSLYAPLTLCWDFAPAAFTPDTYSTRVPVAYNPRESMLINGSILYSYWSSSYVTGSNGHQYVVVSHAVSVGSAMDHYRGSMFDITTSSYTHFYGKLEANSSIAVDARLHIKSDNYTVEALTTDNYSKRHTGVSYDNTGFNTTFEMGDHILFNVGAGTFAFGDMNNEWAMPSGRTEGNLTINGKIIDIIPEKSFTWFDRQWGSYPVSGNWTWYQLHFPGQIKASIWMMDFGSPEQHSRFATILYPDGQTKVVPVEWTTDSENVWVSPTSGNLYPQEWTLKFPDGSNLRINSVYPDQEIKGPAGYPIESGLEAFVTVTGEFEGRNVTGEAYGLAEVQRVT